MFRDEFSLKSFQLQERILRGRKALELDHTGDKIALHAEHLEKNLKAYMSSVRGVFDHISVSLNGYYCMLNNV